MLEHPSRPTRLLVIGNSNSIMHQSYAELLQASPDHCVVNRSIGGTPNVVLLDALATDQDLDVDVIIVETCVIDFVQADDLYTQARSRETLEIFVSNVQARTRARIILLLIPTRFSFLDTQKSWQEQLYLDIAARFGLAVLNVFAILRTLIGPHRLRAAPLHARRAERLVEGFGLSRHLTQPLAWRMFRDTTDPRNGFALWAFEDHAHFAPALHALAAQLLIGHIARTALHSPRHATGQPFRHVTAASPRGGQPIARSSSLLSRRLAALAEGESVTYRRTPGFQPFGLLVNMSRTFGFLRVASGDTAVLFDMRFNVMPVEWIALVVAILEPVGSADIVVSLPDNPADQPCRKLHNTSDRSATVMAELGEMILVEDGPTPPDAPGEAMPIEAQPWAGQLIAAFTDQAALVMSGIDADGHIIDRQCLAAAQDLLARPGLSAADQARVLLLLDMEPALQRLLSTAPPGPDMAQIAAAHAAVCEDRHITAQGWLARVRAADGTDQAEALVLEGLQRFPDDLDLTIQLAWIAHDRHDWTQAAPLWHSVMERFADHSLGYVCLATCLIELERWDEAEAVLAQALPLFPGDEQLTALYDRVVGNGLR